MKAIFCSVLLLGLSALNLKAQEVTLFDREGKAIAYIDYDEEATIFLWKGKRAAFLEAEGDDICVFGFNGKLLGWYEEGVVYDKKGYAVGKRSRPGGFSLGIEPIKGIQEIAPIRPITPIILPDKPELKEEWSETPLVEFLYFGSK